MMCDRKILLLIACALHFSSSAAFAPLNHKAAFTHVDSSISSLAADTSSLTDAPKEISYSTILKVIDEQHYIESTTSCPYLPKETAPIQWGRNSEATPPSTYQHPADPVLSSEAVNALRSAAERYFDANGQLMGQSTARLDDVLSSLSPDQNAETALKLELENSLTRHIYPLIRSAWANDKAFTFGNEDAANANEAPLLSVTSATIFASGGHPGAKVPLTTLERDAGLFVVHFDLGNEHQLSEFSDETVARGGIYFESLVHESGRVTDSVVGPMNPGQVVVHKSDERTAAIITPSNIRELEQRDSRQTLDTLVRRQLLKTAESTRHYALRLVLTTNQSASKVTSNDGTESQSLYPEAPPAERAYRIRNFARLKDDRARYLTLAGLIDVNDHETHLWLGFDYLSRIDKPDYKVDIDQRLSDINKAIFHLKKAAALNPNDPRVHFQLATVLGAKKECEKGMPNHVETNEQSFIQYNEIAAALGKSALYESAAVKLGISGVQDLTSCLNALAQTRCEMGDFPTAINVIDQWAECGSIRSALAIEDMSISSTEEVPSYEWLSSDATGRKVALRTVGDSPLFNDDDRSLLVSAADRSFAQANGKQLSRYTMQYVGNSEVHLDDLCANDGVLKERIDHILKNRVYPLVRQAFAEDDQGGEAPAGPLCVYDSIFVRYNGDEAVLAGRVGASQPLHQDGGIYSVNIALNSHKDDDANGFSGGGTFLEGLSRDNISCIQRPISPGHALLHHTTARHAGAPTTSGIRDILVIFLTARHPQDTISKSENTYRVERPMRLQTIAKQLPRDQLIPCLELAREHDPMNSEMSYWLGVHLLQGDSSDESEKRWHEICRGVDVLHRATELNPTDARAHFHLGMAIASRHKYAMRTKRAHFLPPPGEAAEALIYAFESAIQLEQVCDEAGCKNGINIPAAYLALGDFMGRLRNYAKALEYLSQVEGAIASGESQEDWAMSMLEETASIANFCRSEMQKQQDPSLV